jgi:vancomycin permeability regulator SanA
MKKIMTVIAIIIILIAIIGLSVNLIVKIATKKQLITEGEASKLEDVDCILILGAGVENGMPSPMLEDRLIIGINLYRSGASNKIIMSGDHGKDNYDEVNTMKQFATDREIPSEDVFMDHAGFSTYDSIYRVKEIFGAKKIIIVTQDYHLFRALYIAKSLGLEAYGVKANPRTYVGQPMRDVREVIARNKDFIKCIFKPKPTYLGDKISLKGSGDVTNDR